MVGHLSTSMLEGAYLFIYLFFELISVWIGPIAPIYQQRWDPCLYSHFSSSFFIFDNHILGLNYSHPMILYIW